MNEPEEALLRRAAQTVRETAAPANDIDWRVAVDTEGQIVMGAGGSEVAECRDPYDAAWVALAGRQLAEPLAAWLESEADWKAQDPGVVDPEAIAVARTLLGEPAPTVTAHEGNESQEAR